MNTFKSFQKKKKKDRGNIQKHLLIYYKPVCYNGTALCRTLSCDCRTATAAQVRSRQWGSTERQGGGILCDVTKLLSPGESQEMYQLLVQNITMPAAKRGFVCLMPQKRTPPLPKKSPQRSVTLPQNLSWVISTCQLDD